MLHAQESPAPPEAIRINVDRVNIGAIVTDKDGHFVDGLHREDFHILDNGVEQPLTDFATIEEPAQVLVLVEAGPAVYLLEGGHLRAVFALLNGLAAGDRVALARYDEIPQAVLDFTPDKRAAESAIDSLNFNLGFGNLNLAASLSTVLDWLTKIPGKKSIVLLSTGVDTSTPAAAQALFAKLKLSDVRVLAVSLAASLDRTPPPDKRAKKKGKTPPPLSPAQTSELAQAANELKFLAGSTGGRAYFPVSTKDFGDVYADVAQLVRHEYSLAIVPPVRDGQVHTLEVRVNLPPASSADSTAPTAASAYHIDHRQAYLAPAP